MMRKEKIIRKIHLVRGGDIINNAYFYPWTAKHPLSSWQQTYALVARTASCTVLTLPISVTEYPDGKPSSFSIRHKGVWRVEV